ncbi:MAG TPA: sugar phosphate isomerase/epimerase family protein [Armatimonadaceae bacterium]|nr:sugar phosphate isomerase/epimerase family protein [Armatimonadaceae bacterium]
MKFGVCAGIDQAALLADAGYDYIELSVAGDLVPEADEATWAEKRAAIEAMPLPVEAFNSFVRTGKITGPEADFERLKRYADTAVERAAQVGGKIIVFGSGGARNVPAGFPREQAAEQIVSFLDLCADACDRHGVVVVVEPLNSDESNIINSVAEGAEYVERVARAGIRNLADTYHMEYDGEPLLAITEFAEVLAHVHTADTGRFAPGTGTYDHIALFRELRAARYDDRLSIECSFRDFAAEIGPALAHLKRAHGEANART